MDVRPATGVAAGEDRLERSSSEYRCARRLSVQYVRPVRSSCRRSKAAPVASRSRCSPPKSSWCSCSDIRKLHLRVEALSADTDRPLQVRTRIVVSPYKTARWQLSRMASSQRESPSEATAWFDQCAFVSAAVSLRDGYAFLVRSEASIGSFPGPRVHSDETAVVFQEFLDDGLFHRRGEPVARILAQGKSLGVA